VPKELFGQLTKTFLLARQLSMCNYTDKTLKRYKHCLLQPWSKLLTS